MNDAQQRIKGNNCDKRRITEGERGVMIVANDRSRCDMCCSFFFCLILRSVRPIGLRIEKIRAMTDALLECK